MGEVYLAEDTKLDRRVALKVLINELAEDKERIQRFVREAKAASALSHPNILTVYEIGSFGDGHYISTELIDGVTLRDHMKRESLELRDAIKIVLQITAALGAAHEAGIVHRDIKPENVMIRRDGVVKVLDFGLAKLSPLSTASIETTMPQINTKPGVIVGTVAYMSPEQARGRKIDPRSDIFSLGILMFELFSGQRPFEGESQLELISSILKDEAPQLRQISPDLPRELERIVDKSLRKDLDHRYQHVRDLHIDLEDLDEEIKFESKLNRSIHPTVNGSIQNTNQSQLRSVFTTGIAKTRRFTLLHALIFIAAVAALGGVGWYLVPAHAPSAANYKSREVASWASARGELFSTANFSPDGKMIAFASTKSGTKGIWVTQANSTEAIPVTNDEFANTDPIWSPAGDELAYVSRRSAGGGSAITSIWRVPALGGTPRTVAPVSDGSLSLRSWSKAGKIYYQLRGDLYSIDMASGSSQKITSLEAQKIRWVGITPDERSIIYAVAGENEWSFFKSDIAGSKPIQLAAGSGQIGNGIGWTSSADKIYFSMASEDSSQIMCLRPGASVPERISAPERNSSVVAVSPDGRAVILGSSKEDLNLWRINLADGREVPVARDLDSELWPAVSPDNDKVAFQLIKGLSDGNRLMTGSISIKSLRTSNETERGTVISQAGFLPDFSPDGSQVAYLKLVDEKWNLYAVSATGGPERLLSASVRRSDGYSISPYNLTQTSAFSWSPVEGRIAYIAERDGITNVYGVNASDGSETPLTRNTDAAVTFACPIWSSDGKRIAYSFQLSGRDQSGKRIRGIRWTDVATGESHTVVESPRIIRLLGWSGDRASIFAAESGEDNNALPPDTHLLKFATLGGTESRIASLKNIYFYNIFLSDDGGQIAYAARDQNLDDVWTIPSAGGTPRKLTRNNDSAQFYSRLDWLRDGSAIIFGKQTRFSLLSVISDID